MLRSSLALALIGLSVPALAEPASTLTCDGPFAKSADEAALVKAFGRANVTATEIAGAEGATEHGTVVYPNDPARRMEIIWWDPTHRRRPSNISVKDRSTWTVRGAGAAAKAIGVGTPLAEVEQANGKPFKLSGFGWDYGGFASGWEGGALDHIQGGCNVVVRFEPDPNTKDALLKKVSGDKQVSTSDAAVRGVKPRVSEIALGWPE